MQWAVHPSQTAPMEGGYGGTLARRRWDGYWEGGNQHHLSPCWSKQLFTDGAAGAGLLAGTHFLAVTLQAKSMFEPQRSS